MDKPVLLIADSNEVFCRELSLALSSRFQVLECQTGTEALRLLRQEQPEVLVLDIILPEMDGFTLLEWICAEGICPKVLAFTPLMSDYELITAHRLGIGYMMRKGCALETIVTRILDLNTTLHSTKAVDPVEWVRSTLARFPFPTTYKGYPGVETAIVLLERDPEQSFTNELYVETAKLCHRSKGSIERNGRTLLDSVWANGDPNVWQEFFPGALQRPELSAFLRRMAQALHEALE